MATQVNRKRHRLHLPSPRLQRPKKNAVQCLTERHYPQRGRFLQRRRIQAAAFSVTAETVWLAAAWTGLTNWPDRLAACACMASPVCLATLLTCSYTALAVPIMDLTSATASDEPAGAAAANWSTMAVAARLTSATWASAVLEKICWVSVKISPR